MWDLFRGEVESQMRVFTDSLLALDGGATPEAHLASAMRAAHSIKGAARIVQLDAAVRLAHVMEDCLVAAQESGLVLNRAAIDVLLSAGDMLSRLSTVDETAVPQWIEDQSGALDEVVEQLGNVRAGTPTSPSAAPTESPRSPAAPVPVATPAESLDSPACRADEIPDAARAVAALLFEVAGQRYGLDVSQIVEVVPAVRLRTLPGVPPYVAGLCRYRGTMVPVLDLSQMLGGVPAAPRYSTRLVLVRHQGPSGGERILGLLAERATHGLSEGVGPLLSSGVATPAAPYLGKLATQGEQTVQFVKVEHLIPDDLRGRLFPED